jgi:hypothetical protein
VKGPSRLMAAKVGTGSCRVTVMIP